MKPNLFRWATSELSQDAMLCWLVSWADPACAAIDPNLHRLGQAFLTMLFAKHGREMPQIRSLRIQKQHRGIDILVVLNDDIAICIEDKVNSTEHSDQLRRYLSVLNLEGFVDDRILPIYIQANEQSNYRAVVAAGYGVIRRSDLVKLLREHQGSGNAIVRDFHDYLADMDQRIASFRTRPLPEWDWYAWQGFYMELQHQLGDGEWGYVANPAGGFLGYWWHWHSDAEAEQYLQIEQDRLCFRISVDEADKRSELRSFWLSRLLDSGRRSNFPVLKPQRLGTGQTMSVARYDGEWRICDRQGLLDIDATVQLLRRGENVLNGAVSG